MTNNPFSTNPFTEMNDSDDNFAPQQQEQQQVDPATPTNINEGRYDDLDILEDRLNREVDADFFQDPAQFHTLHRVIDVLGVQMDEPAASSGGAARPPATSDYEHLRQHNPAYRALQKQQQVVEEAIEHMAVSYCADLNSSVVQIGKVARQFRDAVGMVRHLRRQVRDIKETLGSGNSAASASTGAGDRSSTAAAGVGGAASPASAAASPNKVGASAAQAAAMSLRELWLKKLECEAVLVLLEKMEIVRAAPAQFDYYMKPPCRIGAAVVTLSRAFEIAFHSKDVSHVQALQNVGALITDRKQRADQVIWETLWDVLYLRTGNAILPPPDLDTSKQGAAAAVGAAAQGQQSQQGQQAQQQQQDKKERAPKSSAATVASVDTQSFVNKNGMVNPFMNRQGRGPANSALGADGSDDDDESVDSFSSGASLFSRESASVTSKDKKVVLKGPSKRTRMMIPVSLLEAELDLEADEERCLEEASMINNPNSSFIWDDADANRNLPRYVDHVLALRILVECMTKLQRLDDAERTLNENLGQELRKLAQKEQAKTFARLERHVNAPGQRRRRRFHHRNQDLKEFRRHLTGLLSSFGCVMIRLSHLAQIFRHRISAEKKLVLLSYQDKSTAMRTVLVHAYDIMQREIKEFLKGCLIEEEDGEDATSRDRSHPSLQSERGLFSLGITDTPGNKKDLALANSTSRAANHLLPASKFVTNVLMPKTNCRPQVRHALEFRRSLAKWTAENDEMRKELAGVTGEDTTSPSYNARGDEETALTYLDEVIKKQLIPVMQHDAINGTTQALEREDAFDPVIDRGIYGRPTSNEPSDVDMCVACQALYYSTGPLFLSLHRLPKDEKMYLHLVGVLEHTILTFISRVKPRVAEICNRKTALKLLLDAGNKDKEKSFGNIIEKRKAFTLLLRAYADGDLLEATATADDSTHGFEKDPNLTPLSPSPNDTQSRSPGATPTSLKDGADDLDFIGGVEKEEQLFGMEVGFLDSVMNFSRDSQNSVVCCSDEELMKACVLAHSLLKLSSLLDSRLKVRSGSFDRTLTSTRALREAIKSIKAHGVKMAKFCRIDMLLQNATRLSKICKSSTIVAKDAVRIPSCVNDLGEYLTGASDNLREAGGNAVTAYTFSSLEQYIPLFLMQTVRIIARGEGIVSKSPLTLNGVEALDRSGSVLYRDLKGATSFDNSFWDDELAAISFERSASFMAMLEVEMDELEAYYRGNHQEFSQADFELMFSMNGPRRKGDPGRYHLLRKKLKLK